MFVSGGCLCNPMHQSRTQMRLVTTVREKRTDLPTGRFSPFPILKTQLARNLWDGTGTTNTSRAARPSHPETSISKGSLGDSASKSLHIASNCRYSTQPRSGSIVETWVTLSTTSVKRGNSSLDAVRPKAGIIAFRCLLWSAPGDRISWKKKL